MSKSKRKHGRRKNTNHSKLAPDLVREIPKDEHANNRASKSQWAQSRAVVVCSNSITAIDTIKHWDERVSWYNRTVVVDILQVFTVAELYVLVNVLVEQGI